MTSANSPSIFETPDRGADLDAGPSAKLLDLVERVAGAGSWRFDSACQRVTLTPQLALLLDLPNSVSLTPEQMLSAYAPHTRNLMEVAFDACTRQGQSFDQELEIATSAGKRLWVRSLAEPVRDASGLVVGAQGMLQDLTLKKRDEEASLRLNARMSTMVTRDQIEHLAFYDALTQLPNRQLLMERLQRALAQSESHNKIGALMFIDLDHFKLLNDTLGHSKGDLLLQKVATRLTGCVRATDTVARLGGDEFVVLLEDQGETSRAADERTRAVSEKLLNALREPYDLIGHQYHGSCSIGVTFFSRFQESIGDLLKQTDLAMYQAKASGRNAVCFFDPEMQALATANAALTSELRQGLREQAFALYYQPQFGRGGRMTGVEALIRWNHPLRGLVYPGEFIAHAEDSGLVLPIGKWALETACEQLAQWAKRPETEPLSIAVNVSVCQFRQPEFVEMVLNVIDQAGVRPDRLKLELTETLLATHIDVTIAKMGRLKDAGVTLAIDDFGIGYSALSYLKYLPLDQLKIDRTFVKDVLSDPNDAAIARTIIGLAQSLGLGVMAEGVETEAQRAFLERHGCEAYQGYLFSPPLPIAELELFIKGVQTGSDALPPRPDKAPRRGEPVRS